VILIPVNELLGIGGVPRHRSSASRWLSNAGCTLVTLEGDGRRPQAVRACDLPEDVRRAWLERSAAEAGLAPGGYDDAAHEAFAAAPPTMRDEAERRAAVVRLVLSVRDRTGLPERLALVKDRLGEAPSQVTLKRWLKAVQGGDPVDFAPALLPGCTGLHLAAPGGRRGWGSATTPGGSS
jgi:putative transposase